MGRVTGIPISQSLLTGGLLTLTGGFLDAYTYLLRGHVFANAQTGNVVLLGLSIARGEPLSALSYLIPLLAFVAGVLVVETLRGRFRATAPLHWRQLVIVGEILLLLAVAFVPQGKWDSLVNLGISFLCAMQVESFRSLEGNAYATTMCTGNLRSGTERFYQFLVTKNPRELKISLLYLGILLFFILGAGLGLLFCHLLGEKAVLFCCLMLAFAFGAMFF